MKALQRLKKSLFPSEKKKTLRRWRKDGGDLKLRYDYPLTPDSVVLDVGGFEGEWGEKIFNKYRSEIHVFEPVASFYESVESLFKNNSKVNVHHFGLGGENRTEAISLEDNASSIYKANGQREEIHIVDIAKWMKENGLSEIDLMKINIEGGEYELLEKLIQCDALKYFKNIQVQFHDFVPKADMRMKKIQDELAKTHRTTYSYRYIWENWERR
jgi:FkbM family methyltransferase